MKVWVFATTGLPPGPMRSIMELPHNLIMRYQWGVAYSHIAMPYLENPNPLTVYEAVGQGVVCRAWNRQTPAAAFYVEVTAEQYMIMQAFLKQQLGKDYDFMGLLGFLWRSNKWQDPTKWFCSELIAAAFKAAGVPIFNWNIIQPHQIPPQLLVSVLSGPVPIEDAIREIVCAYIS